MDDRDIKRWNQVKMYKGNSVEVTQTCRTLPLMKNKKIIMAFKKRV